MKETILAGSFANGPYKNRQAGTLIYTYRVARGDRGHCLVDGRVVAGVGTGAEAGQVRCVPVQFTTAGHRIQRVCGRP